MNMITKKDIFQSHLSTWLAYQGDRKKRGEMIKHISIIAQVHPKSVNRSFKRVQFLDRSSTTRRGRHVYYTKDVDNALYDIWQAANCSCGELLHPVILEYIESYKQLKRWRHSSEATDKLLLMSEGTVKRKVVKLRQNHDIIRGRSTTKPSDLKQIVPIFKGPWTGLKPGHGQLDTVAHCGHSLIGDYAYTVSFIDAATYWGVRRAQWNKGQTGTKESLIAIKKHLPFPWLMAHPDTGSEFINWIAKKWYDKHGIRLTRSEPNKKNDNMYVEERNGHVVRKYLGWQRLDADLGVILLMNNYYHVLDLYLNHFQAVKRTTSKSRIGSKYLRTLEKVALTPYQRAIKHKNISSVIKKQLRQKHNSLNPILLKEKLDLLKEKIFDYQKKATG